MDKSRLFSVLIVLLILASVDTYCDSNATVTAELPSISVLYPNGGETLYPGTMCEVGFSYFYTIDADGDTMNNSVDPFPLDFNNDGIPDTDTWGTHNNGYGPDVDSDGWTDYPYGNDPWYKQDCWLNTTIPHHPPFPKDAWDRNACIYIGPTCSTIPRLKLEFSSDGLYGNYSQIYDSTNRSKIVNGSYDWTVPDLESARCYIRATLWYENNTYTDTSDSAFSIAKMSPDRTPIFLMIFIVVIVIIAVVAIIWKLGAIQKK
jgi:hypothetical protein